MSEELEVLKLIADRFDKENISYMVTGSIATNFYAVPRMTRDIDIVIQLKSEDVPQIIKIFEKDFYLDEKDILTAVRTKQMFNIIHNKSVVKIDFIVKKNEPYRELEFSRRQKLNLEGHPIWVVSVEDLILSKLFWAKESMSEFQIKDVKMIFGSQKKLNMAYINEWIQKMDLENIYSMVKL